MRVKYFYVNFCKDKNYYRRIALKCTSNEISDKFILSDFVRNLENKYGAFDIYGDVDDIEIGFESDKLLYEDAPIVWDKIVNELKRLNLAA